MADETAPEKPDEPAPVMASKPTAPKAPAKPKRKKAAAPDPTQEFRDAFKEIATKAKAAGVHPLKVMIEDYARQGLGLLDSLSSGLDRAQQKPKKRGKG